MHDIERFLQNPVWSIGVELHKIYGTNGGLKFLFSLGETRDSMEKLCAEMQLIWEAMPPDTKTGGPKAPAPTEPDSILTLRKKDMELYEDAKAKFERMKAGSISKQERFELAKGIKSIFREKDDIYNVLLEYEETGLILTERPKFDVSQATDADLLKRQRTLRSYFAPSKADKVANLEVKKAELEAIDAEIIYRNL